MAELLRSLRFFCVFFGGGRWANSYQR